MKIAYLSRRPIPSRDAQAVQIVKMCEAFGKLGHEVVLFVDPGDDNPDSIFSRYNVGRIFSIDTYPKRIKYFKRMRFIMHILRDSFIKQADIYYGRDITSLAAVAWLGKPVIYEAHSIPRIKSFRWRLLSWLFAQNNFHHLVCVTSTLVEIHRQQFPALASKPIIVAPSAASEVPIAQDEIPWSGRPDALQIGFVGRPFPGKGIEIMLEAAKRLTDIDFHVIGANEVDISWMQVSPLSNLFFHGYQPHGKLGSFFKRLDIAVAPYGAKVMNASRRESAAFTSPQKLLEYMAAGLPSIVSNLPGVSDIVASDGEGVTILIPPGDERAFIDALSQLAKDADLRQRMGKAARMCYLKRHTMEARAVAVLGDMTKQ